MINIFKYGPPKKVIKVMVWLSWPIIIAGKKFSSYPVLKWIIYPFFRRPWNEVTSIPINVPVEAPSSVTVPIRVLERLVRGVNERFALNECICRGHNKCDDPPRSIGCLALGPATKRMHPSNGRYLSEDEALAHIKMAASHGLIANIAHVWIDPLAYQTRFKDLMFICFCDDTNCLYRTHMKKRGPTLDGTYKKLPGIEVTVDAAKCTGCGACIDPCFVAAIEMKEGKAVIGVDCKGCGRCVDVCPEKAIDLTIANEEELYRQMLERISEMSTLVVEE